ncbi:hypothetical protein EHV15_34935 [Paenibacillus oralis]|uniref:Uncharacterized protein n=1 Tax=Paenibacillus oralis TaxID=2490856 RepID=A0A3P3TB89_9BACL|nr:hypothetical protein [Paenibacillus oralis]RRJ54789.1 hypothetical protein EHV15_34935 [Paenibacillus oralis]
MIKNSRTVRNRSRSRNRISVSDGTKHSVTDQKLKQKLYKICFKENSRRSVLLDKRAIAFEVIAISALSTLIIFVMQSTINIAVKNVDPPTYYGLAFAGLLLIAILCLIGTGVSSNLYVKRKYSDLSFLVSRFSINFNTDILFSVRCDAVYEFLKNESKLDCDHIDYLIGHYTERSETIRKQKWLPFAILSAFLFPFWNVTVSKTLNWSDFGTNILLFIFAILLSSCMWIWRRNIESTLFSKSNNYLYIASILRTIKSYPKRRYE